MRLEYTPNRADAVWEFSGQRWRMLAERWLAKIRKGLFSFFLRPINPEHGSYFESQAFRHLTVNARAYIISTLSKNVTSSRGRLNNTVRQTIK